MADIFKCTYFIKERRRKNEDDMEKIENYISIASCIVYGYLRNGSDCIGRRTKIC